MEEIYKWGNIVDHQKLFSTHLFLYDDYYKDSRSEMKKYISDLWANRKYDENWQTKSADLHKKKEFESFVKQLIQANKVILNTLKYDIEDIVITDMWANVIKFGEAHRPHTHSNNFLSGVWYLQSDGNAGIVFCDPRPASKVIVPRKKENILDNADIVQYASRTNRAIMFPSWLVHYVPINKSKNNRISISWNIQLKGQLGEHHEFQSANY